MEEKTVKKVRVKVKKNRKLRPGKVILIMGILVYFVMFFHSFFGQMIKTYIVNIGSIEDVDNMVGFVIRDEKVLRTGMSEKFKPARNEGERVARGATVATIYSQSVDSIQEKISEIDEKIKQVAAEQAKNQIGTQLFSQDIQKIDDNTNRKIIELCSYLNDDNLKDVKKLKNEIDENLKKKAEISGKFGPANKYINSLISQKSYYENNMKALEENITTDTPGIISYSIDGYEDVLVPQNIPAIDINQLETLAKKENNSFSEGTNGIKIVDNFKCYIVVIFQNSEKLKKVKAGDKLWLRFPDLGEEILSASIDSITDKGQGKSLVSFMIDMDVEKLLNYRKINVDVLWSTSTGLKVPITSIIQRNGVYGVMTVNANYAQFEEVEIISKDNEYAIIKEAIPPYNKGISLYEEIVVNGENVEEGRQIHKWN